MKTHTTTLHRAVPALMLASLAFSAGLLPAQDAEKRKKPGAKQALAAAQPATQPAGPPVFKEAIREPAVKGEIDKKLYAVFGEVAVPGLPTSIDTDGKIYVRSYALGDENKGQKTLPSIPGPTFVFQPGDLLRLRFHNFLNRSQDPALNAIQSNTQHTGPPGAASSSDDTDEHVSHEISIPNDSNVTNLHVHGLHVDPKQDDVTLLVLPEDNDPGALTPELQRFVPTINRWWTRNYQYKLPKDHLPGTYWYHSHKHGSTSSQVENGMAGTLIIRPDKEENDIVPGLWDSGHDRVMMIQELANYSTGKMKQNDIQGRGQGQGSVPVTTVNGQYQPLMQLPPGQIERWRFIVAGANHTTSSYIWAGCIKPIFTKELLAELGDINAQTQKTPQLKNTANFTCLPLPLNSKVKLIALDGITMWQSRDVTPLTPAFGSAGNRLDLLAQVDPAFKPDGNLYRIYQNYPLPPLADLASFYPELFDASNDKSDGQAVITTRYKALTKANKTFANSAGSTANPAAGAGNITTDPFLLGANYQQTGNTVNWANVNADGSIQQPVVINQYPVVPILRGSSKGNGVEIDQDFPQKFEDGAKGWQPLPDAGGGNPVSANILVNLDISGKPNGPTEFPAALDDWLFTHSPAGAGNDKTSLQRVNPASQELEKGIPHYVSPMPDEKIAGAQVAVFDRGQFTFSYVNKATQQQIDVRQFWINGRQFNVDDWIGNPAAENLIKQPLNDVEPSLGLYSPSAAASAWTHQKGKEIFITNPGYNTPIKQIPGITGTDDKPVFNYDYAAVQPLTYKAITGLDKPHTPVSTTAEEWLLVNNSDLFHPFHIHINPFFVTEIGQLSYNTDPKKKGKHWELNKITLTDKGKPNVPFSWVVGNWWDVITIPPHGYVRFRMWIDVPSQFPVDHGNPDSDLVVYDNANVYGSWVFHCHILRHEDRGMMLMVNTKPKGVDLDGKWTQDGGTMSYQIEDNHGGLAITAVAEGAASLPPNFTRGTFNRGIGNPLFSQPFLGSMTDTSAAAISAFCVVNDPKQPAPNRMLLSNGHFLSRSGSAGDAQIASTKLDLTGDWVDVENRVVTISQTPSQSTKGLANLVFTPKTNVWWSSGEGSWVPSPQPVPPATTPPPVAYTGTQVVKNYAGQNQLLTFCISQDVNTLVFSNGITWTRKSN